MNSTLYFDGELCEIGGRGPEAGGSLLGVDMPGSVHRMTTLVMGMGGVGLATLGDGLLVTAVGHAERREDVRLHDLLEGLLQKVGECELHNQHPTAGIFAGRIWRSDKADWAESRRGLPIQDLDDGRERRARRVAGETEAVVGAGGMAEERARGDGLRAIQIGLWDVPRLEECVDVVIERESAFLNETKRGHGGDRFADGCGLKEGVGLDGSIRLDVHHAVTFRPLKFEVLDDGDAEAGNVEALHDLQQGESVETLAVGDLRGFDLGDECDGVARGSGGWLGRLRMHGRKP